MSYRWKIAWVALAVVAFVVGGLQPVVAQEGAEEAEQTLYERLGGLPAISVVVSDFIDVLVPDPILNENPAINAARERVPAAYLKYHVTAMVCQATGGPCTYHGRGMEESHAHLNITEEEWDRMVELFLEVLAKYDVPEAETQELLEIVGSTKSAIVTSPADQAKTSLLDGRTFEVEMTKMDSDQVIPNTLTFDAGTFLSAVCVKHDFSKSIYEATETGDAIAFEVNAQSSTKGTMDWEGTVSGDQLAATAIWYRPEQEPVEFSIRGSVR